MNLTDAISAVVTAAGSLERVAVETGSTYPAVYSWLKGKRVPGRSYRLQLANYARRLGLSKSVLATLQPDFADEARP